jgi:hypothetical protein
VEEIGLVVAFLAVVDTALELLAYPNLDLQASVAFLDADFVALDIVKAELASVVVQAFEVVPGIHPA